MASCTACQAGDQTCGLKAVELVEAFFVDDKDNKFELKKCCFGGEWGGDGGNSTVVLLLGEN